MHERGLPALHSTPRSRSTTLMTTLAGDAISDAVAVIDEGAHDRIDITRRDRAVTSVSIWLHCKAP